MNTESNIDPAEKQQIPELKLDMEEALPSLRTDLFGLTTAPSTYILSHGMSGQMFPGMCVLEVLPGGNVSLLGAIAFNQIYRGAFFDTDNRYFVSPRRDGTPAPVVSAKSKQMSDMLLEGPLGYNAIITCFWRFFRFTVQLEVTQPMPGFSNPCKLVIQRPLLFKRNAICVYENHQKEQQSGQPDNMPNSGIILEFKGGASASMVVPAGTPRELLPMYSMVLFMYRQMCLQNFWTMLALTLLCLVVSVGSFIYSVWVVGGVFMGLFVVLLILSIVFY
jgi:hypothetical protein